MYDKKIAIVIKKDLPDWQKLNVTAFLASAAVIRFPESFVYASGSEYLPFVKHPILIYKAETDEQLRRAFNRAKERGQPIGIYIHPLFSSKNEEGNLIEIAKYSDDEQPLAGIIIYYENKKVNKSIAGLKFQSWYILICPNSRRRLSLRRELYL